MAVKKTKKKTSKKKTAKKAAPKTEKRAIPADLKPFLTAGGKNSISMRGEGGRTTGCPLDLACVVILEQNRKHGKKADEAIAQMLAKEFPDSKREYTASFVNTCRTAYNNGRLRSQQAGHVADPKTPIPRFGKGGAAEEVKRGRRPGVHPKAKGKGIAKKTGAKKLRRLKKKSA